MKAVFVHDTFYSRHPKSGGSIRLWRVPVRTLDGEIPAALRIRHHHRPRAPLGTVAWPRSHPALTVPGVRHVLLPNINTARETDIQLR
jgi:hypothetical protein